MKRLGRRTAAGPKHSQYRPARGRARTLLPRVCAAGQRSLQARRALVSLAWIAEWPVNNRGVSAPHDDMHRRRRESHGWHAPLRSGRVAGSREGGDSSAATGLVRLRVQAWVALATAPLRMAKRVSKRATRGGERQSTEAPGYRIRAPRPERPVRSVWRRRAWFPGVCGAGDSSVRRLGGSALRRWPAARHLTGPVAEATAQQSSGNRGGYDDAKSERYESSRGLTSLTVGDRTICPRPLLRATQSVPRACIVDLKLTSASASAQRRSRGVEHVFDLTGWARTAALNGAEPTHQPRPMRSRSSQISRQM